MGAWTTAGPWLLKQKEKISEASQVPVGRTNLSPFQLQWRWLKPCYSTKWWGKITEPPLLPQGCFFFCFFFHCFLKEVPQTSHLMWSLYYVWTLGTQQTKRKGNQTPFFSSGSIFPSCSQSLKLLVILFRDTFAMWANSVFSVFLKLHSLAVPFFVIIFFLFFSSSSKTSKWYCSQSSSKRTKSSAFSFITIL